MVKCTCPIGSARDLMDEDEAHAIIARCPIHGLVDNASAAGRTLMLGAGYHRQAFPADATDGKRKVMVDKASSMERLGELLDEAMGLEADIVATVGAALTAGASWADIGMVLGISRQGASQRFREARRSYMALHPEDRARVDKLAGVGERRIIFQVRRTDEGHEGAVWSRHHTAEKARGEASKVPGGEVWKVYPQGRAVRLP